MSNLLSRLFTKNPSVVSKTNVSTNTLQSELVSIEKDKLQQILSAIDDSILILDFSDKIIYANQSLLKLLGKDFSQIKGQLAENLFRLSNQANQPISLKDLLASNISNNEEELDLTIPNSTNIKVQLAVYQISIGYVIILHNITEHKAFEQMQIDFVSMASHEIRTPLTSIHNYLSVIQEEARSILNPELKGFLDRALESTEQLSALVENILNVSKIERGSMALTLRPLDWNKKITEIVEDNKIQALKKNINLNLSPLPHISPQVMADDIRINEVINNLLNNAINYTPEGGQIKVEVTVDTNIVTTAITDTGPGIPKDVLPNLFKKFYRVPGALQQMQKGSGLGLFISKSIIELSKGKMWVESEVGKGSTFFFTLPKTDNSQIHPTIVGLKPIH